MQRIVQTQVPTDRVAELKMLLTVPCVDMVTACNVGESCQPNSGTCGPNKVDSSTLPTYGAGGESPGSDLTGGGSTGFGGNAGEFVGTAGFGGDVAMTRPDAGSPLGAGGISTGTGPPPFCVNTITKGVVVSDLLSNFEGNPSPATIPGGDIVTGVNPTGRWFSYTDFTGSMITPATGAWMCRKPWKRIRGPHCT